MNDQTATCGAAPWSRVLLLPLGNDVDVAPPARVRLAVAVHRTLISHIGFGADPDLTGKYPPGRAPAVTRVAIQCLPADYVARHGVTGSAVAILLPSDSEIAAGQARAAAQFMAHVTGLRVAPTVEVDGENFWPAPQPGFRRLWCTDTVAVADSNHQRPRAGAPRWTLADAARVSVGMVWRRQVGELVSGQDRFRELSERVAALGVTVHDTQVVRDEPDQWVHAVPAGLRVNAYRATIEAPQLIPARALTAIGQSRHFGAGLLVPRDIPEPSGRDLSGTGVRDPGKRRAKWEPSDHESHTGVNVPLRQPHL